MENVASIEYSTIILPCDEIDDSTHHPDDDDAPPNIDACQNKHFFRIQALITTHKLHVFLGKNSYVKVSLYV